MSYPNPRHDSENVYPDDFTSEKEEETQDPDSIKYADRDKLDEMDLDNHDNR